LLKAIISLSTNVEIQRSNAIKKLYFRVSTLSFSNNLVSPILPYLIVYYGGGVKESGVFQASNNLLGNIGQIIWGRISDVTGFRKLMLLLGSLPMLLVSTIYLMLITLFNSINPYEIITLSAIATFIGSSSAPVIGDVISDLSDYSRRAVVYSIHSNLSAIFSIVGNLVTTIIFQAVSNTSTAISMIILLAFTSASASVLVTLSIPKSIIDKNINTIPGGKVALLNIIEYVKSFKISLSNKKFRGFAFANTFYNFSLSLAWPLFIITQRSVLNLSPAQITSFSIASNAMMILSQYITGRHVSRNKYRFFTLVNRFGLVMVPLTYAFSTDYIQILLLNIFVGFVSGFTNIIFPMYIVECAEEKDRATFFGVYNTLIGLASFAGSMVGGLVSGYLITIFGLVQGLRISYLISAIMRFISAVITLKIKEYVY